MKAIYMFLYIIFLSTVFCINQMFVYSCKAVQDIVLLTIGMKGLL